MLRGSDHGCSNEAFRMQDEDQKNSMGKISGGIRLEACRSNGYYGGESKPADR